MREAFICQSCAIKREVIMTIIFVIRINIIYLPLMQ